MPKIQKIEKNLFANPLTIDFSDEPYVFEQYDENDKNDLNLSQNIQQFNSKLLVRKVDGSLTDIDKYQIQNDDPNSEPYLVSNEQLREIEPKVSWINTGYGKCSKSCAAGNFVVYYKIFH